LSSRPGERGRRRRTVSASAPIAPAYVGDPSPNVGHVVATHLRSSTPVIEGRPIGPILHEQVLGVGVGRGWWPTRKEAAVASSASRRRAPEKCRVHHSAVTSSVGPLPGPHFVLDSQKGSKSQGSQHRALIGEVSAEVGGPWASCRAYMVSVFGCESPKPALWVAWCGTKIAVGVGDGMEVAGRLVVSDSVLEPVERLSVRAMVLRFPVRPAAWR